MIQSLLAAVKQHAEQNYERGGWDYIVETCNDDELIKYIGKATTVKSAIRNVRVKSGIGFIHARENEYRANAVNEGWIYDRRE